MPLTCYVCSCANLSSYHTRLHSIFITYARGIPISRDCGIFLHNRTSHLAIVWNTRSLKPKVKPEKVAILSKWSFVNWRITVNRRITVKWQITVKWWITVKWQFAVKWQFTVKWWFTSVNWQITVKQQFTVKWWFTSVNQQITVKQQFTVKWQFTSVNWQITVKWQFRVKWWFTSVNWQITIKQQFTSVNLQFTLVKYLRRLAPLYCHKLSDGFYDIRKKINLLIFTKSTIHFCIGVNILIKKNYTRQRSHIMMAFLNNFCL